MELSYDTEIPLLSKYPGERKTLPDKDTYVNVPNVTVHNRQNQEIISMFITC